MRRAVLLSCLALVAGAGQAHALSRESVLHSFTLDDGVYPQSSLVADRQGTLYGTALQSGNGNGSVVFAIDAQGTFTIIYRFQGPPNDGSGSASSLMIDRNGNLYGTTLTGGSHNDLLHGGTVFELAPAGNGKWTETVLYNFCSKENCADGDRPLGPLTMAKDGTLYGTTQFGGNGAARPGSGTLFHLSPQGGGAWKQTVLHDFCNQADCADGAQPFAGGLLLTKSGLIYGTTAVGGHAGTLYALAADGSGYQVLHDFGVKRNDGQTPLSGVVAGPDGVLYGTTQSGGEGAFGTVYSYDPASQVYRRIHSFCLTTTDGCLPEGQLMLVADKKGPRFYGTTTTGGEGNSGTIFKLVPPNKSPDAGWKEKPVYNFCTQTGCDDGSNPSFVALLRHRGKFYGTTAFGGSDNVGVVFRFGWERQRHW